MKTFSLLGSTILFCMGSLAGFTAWKDGLSLQGFIGILVAVLMYASAISICKLIDEQSTT